MKVARGQVRYAETFVFIFTLMSTIFVIIPLTQHDFPSMAWLPFDPLASNFSYYSTFTWQAICTATVAFTVISANVYVYMVLICLSFNYILLGQRFKRLGQERSQVDVYGDLIQLIKLHLKMNE